MLSFCTLSAGGYPVDTYTQPDDTDEKLKALQQGSLGENSAYTLTPSNSPSDVIKYLVEDKIRYYDTITGQEVSANDRLPDREYSEVTTKVITPKYFSFSLKRTDYGNGNNNVESFTVPYGYLGTANFTYSYNEAYLQPQSANVSGDVTGVFYGLERTASGRSGDGGAIQNQGERTINSINADFINNKSLNANGGAISNYNNTTINSIEGTFINNSSHDEGGAIWNWNIKRIESIKGDFIGNHINTAGKSHRGGALFNGGDSSIGSVTGNFIGNYSYGTSGFSENDGVVGGAIYNAESSTIGTITGDFIGNYCWLEGAEGHGGAIYNYKYSTIDTIKGDFIGNYIDALNTNGASWGGAITNQKSATINYIEGDFIGNYIVAGNSGATAGAIYNNRGATIGLIKGNFIDNHVSSINGEAAAGAIVNFYTDGKRSEISQIDGNFYGNYAQTFGSGRAQGGAIANYDGGSDIGTINGDFIGNYAQSKSGIARGGAIYTDSNSAIASISGNFYDNYAYSESGEAYGGAIKNDGALNEIKNGIFVNNYAKTDSGKAHGGAVHNKAELTIAADAATSLFQGNYVQVGNGAKDYEAVYADGGTITLNAVNNGHIIFEDKINGINSYKLKLTGDTDSYITFNNTVNNANITMDNVTMHLGVTSKNSDAYGMYESKILETSNLTVNSGLLSAPDGRYTKYYFNNLISEKDAQYYIDGVLNANNQISDQFIMNSGSGTVTVKGIQLASYDEIAEEQYRMQIIKSNGNTAPELNIDGLSPYKNAEAIMTSDDVLYGGLTLDTTKTKNDTLVITGWKDNLASWAELEVGANQDKEFKFVKAKEGETRENHILSRDVKSFEGTNLDLIGNNRTLNVNNKNLFGTNNDKTPQGIADGQKVSISDLTLINTTKDIINNGDLSLDTVTMTDSRTQLTNHKFLNIAGKTTIGGTLTNTNTVNFVDADASIDNLNTNGTQTQPTAINISKSVVTLKDAEASNTNFDISQTSDVTFKAALLANSSSTIVDNSKVTYEKMVNADDNSNFEIKNNSVVKFNSVLSADAGTITVSGNSKVLFANSVDADETTINVSDDSEIEFSSKYSGLSASTTADKSTLIYNGQITSNNTAIALKNDSKLYLNEDIIGNNSTVNLNKSKLYLGKTETLAPVPNKTYEYDYANNSLAKSDVVLTDSNVYVSEAKDTKYTNYNIKKLSSTGTKYSIDLKLTPDEQKSDTFTVGVGSTGTIDIGSVSIDASEADDEARYVVQIVKSADGGVQLTYDNPNYITEATANMESSAVLAKEFGLATTDTKDDSLVIVGWRDILAAWAELEKEDGEIVENKTFTFVDTNNAQKLTRNIDRLNGKDLTLKGNGNTLNIQGHNLFSNINEDQKVSVSNMELLEVPTINNDGTLILDTVVLENSSEIVNNKTLNIQGQMNINGTINNYADTNITNAETVITGTVTGEKGEINIGKSTVLIADGADINNQKITNTDSTTVLSMDPSKYSENFANNALTMKSGDFIIPDLGLNKLNLTSLDLQGGDIHIKNVSVDLANKNMGRITADQYKKPQDGHIVVEDMILTSDSKDYITPVKFADSRIKDTVKSEIKSAPTGMQVTKAEEGIAYSPIYKYSVTYDTSGKYGQDGYFVFSRPGAPGKSPDNYNPAVLSTPVANQAAGQAAMTESFRYVFEHADAFTQLPKVVRTAKINANRYALSSLFNNNLGSLCYDHDENEATWFRPYSTFENINLANGPKVDTISYGSLVGFDTDFHRHKNGWASVTTGYLGYMGSQLHYGGVDTTMNGGLLGLTQTYYKDNFWTALTTSVGAGVADTRTMYGKEDTTMLMAGIANKSGYNFEFKDGKYILQPIAQLSYTMVNTFDYTNAAGVKINSSPMHTVQLNPSIRFISNFENGWQPYAQVGMVWNVFNHSNTIANDVHLPNMYTRSYVEYGIGIQRNWSDKFTAFGQAMVRNGGRNGIALTAGLRWVLGRNSEQTHDVKVQNDNFVPSHTTSRTSNQAVIRPL